MEIFRGVSQFVLDSERDAVGNLLRFSRIQVTGLENAQSLNGAPAIYCIFPHTSNADSGANRFIIPNRHDLVYFAKEESWSGWKEPIAGLINEIILLPTSNGKNPKHAIKTAVQRLHDGYSIGISPEGTRTLKPIQDRKFHPGIQLLSALTKFQYPLVPILLYGFEDIWPKGRKIPRPFQKDGLIFRRKRTYVHFGTPVFFTDTHRDTMVEEFRRECIRQYEAVFGGFADPMDKNSTNQ
jgi:1-acyl-sn-glycerol-3-phosphate acyltransferase